MAVQLKRLVLGIGYLYTLPKEELAVDKAIEEAEAGIGGVLYTLPKEELAKEKAIEEAEAGIGGAGVGGVH